MPVVRIPLERPPPVVPLPSLSNPESSQQNAPSLPSLTEDPPSKPYFFVIGDPGRTSFLYSLLASTARPEELYRNIIADLCQNAILHDVFGELGLMPVAAAPLADAAGGASSSYSRSSGA